MKYSLEQLMPKRYPENRPSTEHRDYFCQTDWGKWGFKIYYYDGGFNVINNEIRWFLDIPGAPEEVRPRKYPDERPEREGVYIVHNSGGEKWDIMQFYSNGYWNWPGRENGMTHFNDGIDYFIDYPLEEEKMEEAITDEDYPFQTANKRTFWDTKYLQADISHSGHSIWMNGKNGMANFTNWLNVPSGELTDFAKYWLDLEGYDITPRQPEVLPCPNPECDGGCRVEHDSYWCGEDKGDEYYFVQCENCNYAGPAADTPLDAIRLHNLIAGKSSKC